MVKYTDVVWDFNGTILNDTSICLEILSKHMRERELKPLSMEEYRDVFDFPLREFYARVGFDFNSERYEDIADSFIKEYSENRFKADIFPGLKSILARIVTERGNNHILSAYRQKDLESMTEHLNIREYFKSITGLNDHYAHGKSDIAEDCLNRNAIDPHSAVLIGDTAHDLEVSRIMGIDSILIASGHHSYKRLKAYGTRVFESHHELLSELFI